MEGAGMTDEEFEDRIRLVFDPDVLRARAQDLERSEPWQPGSGRIVTVVCTDSGHPKGRIQKLLTYRGHWSGRDEEDIQWMTKRSRSRSSKPGRNQASHPYDDWWKRTLEDPEFLPNPSKHGEGKESGIKTVFECTLCGVKFQASDKEKLNGLLTTFWENDVTEIPLATLRAAYTMKQ